MRNYHFTIRIFVLALFLNACNTKNQNANHNDLPAVETTQPKQFEIPRTEVIPIQNTVSGGQYELYIKLPEEYSENKDKKYPVLYFTDAIWHIEILSGSVDYMLEDAILVGISWEKDLKGELGALGDHASRFRDYSVKESDNPELQAKYNIGHADSHLNFIRNDVIKYVENNYRTDIKSRTYFGYSLGGEFGAYILLSQPGTFKNYILGSPTLEGNIPYFKELESTTALNRKGFNANVFISYGSLEEEMYEYAEEFISLMKKRNDESLNLEYFVIEGNHQTAFPKTAVRSVDWLSNLANE